MEYKYREISKKIKTLAYTVSCGSVLSRLECEYRPRFDDAEGKNPAKYKTSHKRTQRKFKGLSLRG